MFLILHRQRPVSEAKASSDPLQQTATFASNMLWFRTVAQIIPPASVLEEPLGPVETGGLRGFIAKFTVLRGAQRELWLTFLIKFLIYTAYSVTNKTMVLWLSKDLSFSDQAAGALGGWVWAPAMTVFTLLAGSLTDAIGLRRTFFFGEIGRASCRERAW